MENLRSKSFFMFNFYVDRKEKGVTDLIEIYKDNNDSTNFKDEFEQFSIFLDE